MPPYLYLMKADDSNDSISSAVSAGQVSGEVVIRFVWVPVDEPEARP